MHIEQIYTGCLSQGAYYIESQGEAAIIDPLRETDTYLKKAERNGAKIKYIFETHFHADFVSGHVSLSEKTGAPIIYGPLAETKFEAISAEDGQQFKLGNAMITVLHTPGHTLESTTYLLTDDQGKDLAIFTGDTLFLGDVGRPDLAQKDMEITQEELAGKLFDSLRNKIMPLADDVVVYPAHGAGSACGKHMMKETVDTLGNQKKVNYALREDMSRDEFIKEVTDGLLPPPGYFPENVKMNQEGYENLDAIMKRGAQPLSPDDLEQVVIQQGALVLDVRGADDFIQGHIPNSIFIGLDGSFAPWVGELVVDVKQPIVLVVEEGREEEAVTRLSRVGFDHTLGYLNGGIAAWKEVGKDVETLNSISAEEYKNRYPEVRDESFDVRKESEYVDNHAVGLTNTPLREINDHLKKFPADKPFYVHCGGGYRSVIAGSILKSRGIHNMVNVEGGFKEMKEVGVDTVSEPCGLTEGSCDS